MAESRVVWQVLVLVDVEARPDAAPQSVAGSALARVARGKVTEVDVHRSTWTADPLTGCSPEPDAFDSWTVDTITGKAVVLP